MLQLDVELSVQLRIGQSLAAQEAADQCEHDSSKHSLAPPGKTVFIRTISWAFDDSSDAEPDRHFHLYGPHSGVVTTRSVSGRSGSEMTDIHPDPGWWHDPVLLALGFDDYPCPRCGGVGIFIARGRGL